MSQVPGASPSRIPSGNPPIGQSAAPGAPGRVEGLAPVHQSKTEVNWVRGHGPGEAIQTSASVLDVTHTTRGTP
jgi:hypothetical protein